MAFIILTLAPEHHHDDAHEGTEEERQERKNRIRVDFPRCDKQTDDCGNAEEDEQCFARTAHKAKGNQ